MEYLLEKGIDDLLFRVRPRRVQKSSRLFKLTEDWR
jgi:hypothetical protein